MRVVHRFRVPAEHPALAGHFPGRPIVPGVILLDEALSAIAAEGGLAAPFRLARVKFLAPVLPEEPVAVLVGEPSNGTLAFACASGARRVLLGTARCGTVPGHG
jgi:3-hydroxymyristoyl/3-hydroxydecanoyl-(acyl carrier protein) dehydratase